jgi:hypothetical protein
LDLGSSRLAHLGEPDEHGRLQATALAQHLIGTPEQAQLLDDGCRHVTGPVRLKGIRLERSRQFGDIRSKKAAFDNWAALSEGAYLLRSNITDWSNEQLWKAYIQLTQAEAAFRIQKAQGTADLAAACRSRRGPHPRCAFRPSCSGRPWKCGTVLKELARIQSHDVVFPTASHGQLRLRCATQPDTAQAALIDRLGVVCPNACASPSTTAGVRRQRRMQPKWSADFSANALICLMPTARSAQAG